MNDQGTCIRPIMTRNSFVNENSIQNTTLAIAATDINNDGLVVLAQYDPQARDLSFVNGIPSTRTTQITLIEGSNGIFLVGQDARASDAAANPNFGIGSETFVGLSVAAVGYSNLLETTAVTTADDTAPQSVVFKMEYVTGGPGGSMYFLGAPRTKIFQSKFNASTYAKSPVDVTFNFEQPAYSVTGNTDPYYVGGYGNFLFDAFGDLVVRTVGAVQVGLDVDTTDPVPSAETVLGATLGSAVRYIPGRPEDPVPQILPAVSDVSSRGFVTEALLGSYGYITAGKNIAPIDPDKIGTALSVRYLQNDPGPSTPYPPGPTRPAIQELASINLEGLGANSGDIRLARFDVGSDSAGQADTLYVFGSDGLTASGTIADFNGPVLAFVSERHVYGTNTVAVQYAFSGTSTPTVTTGTLQVTVNTLNVAAAYQSLTETLNDIVQETISGASLTWDYAYYTSNNTLQMSASGSLYGLLYMDADVQEQSAFAELYGFDTNTNYTIGGGTLTATRPGDWTTENSLALYNGLSWDDTSATGPANQSPPGPDTTRSTITANIVVGPSGAFQGQGISAWSYDPASQSLAFAIRDPTAAGPTSSAFTRQTVVFDHTGSVTAWQIPANTVDLEIHMWGAGGSSDPNSTGTGGAGAYVGGHLHASEWAPLDYLDILVGSAGQGIGQGGAGSRAGIGNGGGRSSIQRNSRDIVSAGGGGGSVGRGRGGAATATDAAAEGGLPSHNGGHGALATKAGRGGHVYGEPKFSKASDGVLLAGGPSTWSLSRKAIGGGGGGGGYYGGGAGGYLGYTGDANDVPTGGGGGSSYTSKINGLRAINGVRESAPFTNSPHYADRVAAGGDAAHSGAGGNGRIVIIATVALSSGGWPVDSAGLSGQVWASKQDAFASMSAADYGVVTGTNVAPANWSSKFVQIIVPPDDPATGQPVAMFYGLNGLCVAVTTTGPVVTTSPAGISSVFWAFVGSTGPVTLSSANTATAFGPIDYVSSDGVVKYTVPPLTQVRSIRSLESINGSRDLIFVGNGVRIITAPNGPSGTWGNPRFVMDSDTGLPLDDTMAFVDAQFNVPNNNLEVVGRPQTLNVTSLMKSPWCPMFASFYDSTDVPTEALPYVGWPTGGPPSGVPLRLPRIVAPPPDNVGNVGPFSSQPPDPNNPLPDYTAVTSITPNTVFLIKRTTDTLWTSVTFYDATLLTVDDTYGPPETRGLTDPNGLSTSLQNALQGYLDRVQPTATAVVTISSLSQLAITIEDLPSAITFELAFTTLSILDPTNIAEWGPLFNSSVSETEADNAMQACGALLGFPASVVYSDSEVAGGTWTASWLAPKVLGYVPTTGTALPQKTPLSVGLSVNSAISGSLYHQWTPTPKLAVVQPNSTWPNGIAVAVGGPILSVTNSYVINGDLSQPVPSAGAPYYLDFVKTTWPGDPTASYRWALMDSANAIIEPSGSGNILDGLTSGPIRSPANILVSFDGAASYNYVQSLLGAYLNAETSPVESAASTYALTGLDAFHLSALVSGPVGPAQFRELSGSGLLNAVISQFNDVKWYANPIPQDPDGIQGVFVAVGQFLWELNAICGSAVTWPSSPQSLNNVMWLSIDGYTWTSVLIVLEGQAGATPGVGASNTTPDQFWICERLDVMNEDSGLLALSTDVGLYSLTIASLVSSARSVFKTGGPVTDFRVYSTDTERAGVHVTPIARTGPYAAYCATRDPTGTCVKCADGAQPVTIPQLVGADGQLEADFEACILKPEAYGLPLPTGYTSIEAVLDAQAIGSYAGWNANKASAYVEGLRQSFYDENSTLGLNSLIICPEHNRADATPATVVGANSQIENELQCTLDQAFQWPDVSVTGPFAGIAPTGPKTGGVLVRRPVTSGGLPDDSYAGTDIAQPYQANYSYMYRHVVLAPYTAASGANWPSTLGIGGSAVAPPTILGAPNVYAMPGASGPTGPYLDNGLSSALAVLVTNEAANSNSPAGSLATGPFQTNDALGPLAGGWNPTTGPQNRAVLANDDLLTQFAYASGAMLRYDPAAVSSTYQSKNPYLYRLSAFPFPHDGVAQDTYDGSATGPRLTPGRDPMVYEPGWGPLAAYGADDAIGFDVYYDAPWGTNPLPEEGFGYWWVRPNSASASLGVFQAGLGFGTLAIAPSGPTWSGPTGPLFVWNPTGTTNAANNSYLSASGPWASVLPYANQGLPNVGPVGPYNATKFNNSLWAMQNMLALRLKNSPSSVGGLYGANNWRYLVSVNFFRPRNWSFTGLLLSTTAGPNYGSPVTANVVGSNGVPQQILATDQPNKDGQYEFLIPDPFFAANPVGATIVGFPSSTYVRDAFNNLVPGPDLEVVSNVLLGPVGSLPPSITALDAGAAAFANIVAGHTVSHYWTLQTPGTTAILDVFVNLTSLFSLIGQSFSWIDVQASMPTGSTTITVAQLQTALAAYGGSFTPPPPAGVSNVIAAILAYADNPLTNIVWTDPVAQTTRSLWALTIDGLTYTGGDMNAVLVSELNQEGALRRANKRSPQAGNYTSTTNSLLHHKWTFAVPTQGTSTITGLFNNGNVNGISEYGHDSTDPANVGFTPNADIRGPTNFNLASNFIARASAINVTASDYDVETNNAPLFATGSGLQLRQDLLAQNPAPGGPTSYGDPVWGFGLRIDATAQISALRSADPQTDADVPVDHGVVSMVRTLVDSQGRFNGTSAAPDQWPHAQRLTYVTKYVPSKLQAYGAIIPMAPMRATLPQQLVLNPLRPKGCALVENVQFVNTWARPTASTVLYNYGTIAGLTWKVFSSTQYDVEAPGFYGRMPLPYYNYDAGAQSVYFDPSGNVKTALYAMDSTAPVAGYDGTLNLALVQLASTNLSGLAIRTLGTAYDAAASGLIGQTAYATYLSGMTTSSAVIGQMVLPMKSALKNAAGLVRFEITVSSNAASPGPQNEQINIRKTTPLGLQSPPISSAPYEFWKYLVSAYNLLFTGSASYTEPSSQMYVTHGELSQIWATAMNAWLVDTGASGLQTNPSATSDYNLNFGFRATFNGDLDRNNIQFFISNTGSTPFGAISKMRVFLPEPLSNWLGLRPVAPPFFNVNSLAPYNTTQPDRNTVAVRSFQNYSGANDDDNFSGVYNGFSGAYPPSPNITPEMWVNPVWLTDTWYLGTDVSKNANDGNAWTSSTWMSPVDYAWGYGAFSWWASYQFAGNTNHPGGWAAGEGPVTPEAVGATNACNVYGVSYDGGAASSCSYNYNQNNLTVTNVYVGASGSLRDWAGINSQQANSGIGSGTKFGNQIGTSAFTQNTSRTQAFAMNLNASYTAGSTNYQYNSNPATYWTGTSWAWKNNSGAYTTSSAAGWTSTGWDADDSSPLYSLLWEASEPILFLSASPPVTLDLIGRQGFTSLGLTNSPAMCDITNVTWTTKLASTLSGAQYLWGIVSKNALSSATFSTYQAGAELTSLTTSGGLVLTVSQNAPVAADFMAPNFVSAVTKTTKNPFGSGPLNAFAYAAAPALEVPCPFGFMGQQGAPNIPGGIVGRPNQYNAVPTGSPEDWINDTALFGGDAGTSNANNSTYATRTCYNALIATGTAAVGSPQDPIQLAQLYTSSTWPSGSQPPLPAPAVGAPVNSTVTTACGEGLYMITAQTMFTIGSTNGSAAKTGSNFNRYAVWAFNYSEIFTSASTVQPWNSGPNSLISNAVNLSALHLTYILGTPYYMDEAYDASAYSTLGRSLLIGPTTTSSTGATVLDPQASTPVVLIVVPVGPIDPWTPSSTDPAYTFSNQLVYSFTGAYTTSPASTYYSVAFDDPENGAPPTFYGLDNTAAVSSTAKAAGSDSVGLSGRRVYYDMSTAATGLEVSEVLGLDVRQVYPAGSLAICAEPAIPGSGPVQPYSPDVGLWTPTFTFRVITYESPSYTNPLTTTCPYLPLSGTWTTDQEPDLTWSAVQYVPNYEGLARVADWTAGPSMAGAKPTFQLLAVDRNWSSAITPPTIAPDNPFALTTYNYYRPTSIFVTISDVWRNQLRAPQNPGALVASQGLPITVAKTDCVGPDDYDNTFAFSSTWWPNCSSGPIPVTTASTGWAETPWIAQGSPGNVVWSPFTGGAYWNTPKDGATASPDNATNFGSSIWWPTYRWALTSTDPSNVWPTAVAVNPTLQANNFAVFTNTDGTIRKVNLAAPGAPVVDSTGINSFYNGSINDVPPVIDYVYPGRLYNLTWWSNNWWCTADVSAIWTTAPLNDANRTPINDPLIIDQFVASIITFRPLSTQEGLSSAWAVKSWPNNVPHPYNLMKVIQYGNQTALLVASVDGSYAVIQDTGNGYSVSQPNLDPTTWFFTPGSDGTTDPILYITDLAIMGDSMVVGSAPLPLNPAIETNVPWYGPSGDISLPVLGLSYTPENEAAVITEFFAGTGNPGPQWLEVLRTANVLSVDSELIYDPNFGSVTLGTTTYGTIPIVDYMISFADTMTADLDGQAPSETSVVVSGSVVTSITAGSSGSGLQRLLKPAWANGPCDAGLVWYPSNPGDPDAQMTITNVNIGYGVQDDPVGTTNPGSILFGFQVRSAMLDWSGLVSGAALDAPAFEQVGFDFAPAARAFFMINNPTGAPQTGLQDLTAASPAKLLPAPNSDLATTSDWSNVIVRNALDTVPMWTNSMAYTVNLRAVMNNAIDGIVLRPRYGPVHVFIQNGAVFTDEDRISLNMYLTPLVARASPLVANLVISDMAYGDAAAAMTWTTYGPFGPEPISISPIAADGSLEPVPPPDDFVPYEAQMVGASVVGFSPYEMKFYVAGVGLHMPDWPSNYNDRDILKPAGIPEASWLTASPDPTWTPKTAAQARLMLLSADVSTGAIDSSGDSAKFTQVWEVVTRRVNRGPILRPVSLNFSNITCFGFSPSITAVGGSLITDATTNPPKSKAIIMFRSNLAPAGNDLLAGWSTLDPGIPGTVTAMAFVGYAWYVATWDATANPDPVTGIPQGASSLFFASINFGAVSLLDAWDAESNVAYQVTSIAATQAITGPNCGPGFEPDPNNPNSCVKKCPQGFKAFGSFCVQNCPPPFTETSVPNECVPDSRAAKVASPTAVGANVVPSPAGTYGQNAPGPSSLNGVTTYGATNRSLDYSYLITYVLFAVIALLFSLAIVFAIYRRRR